MCSEAKLTFDELRHMNINDVFDRIYKYVEFHDTNKKPKARKATQADIDRFF